MSTGPKLARLIVDYLDKTPMEWERRAKTMKLVEGVLPVDDDFDQYRPHGDCATGCGHLATEVWALYKGNRLYHFRCKCCVAQGKLDRALWHRDQIPALTAAVEQAKKTCEKENDK